MSKQSELTPQEQEEQRLKELNPYAKYANDVAQLRTPYGLAGGTGSVANRSLSTFISPEELSTYSEYNVNYNPLSDNPRFRAENQPFLHQLNRSLNPLKLTAAIGFGIAENIGYLASLVYDEEGDYSNALTEFAKQGRESLDKKGGLGGFVGAGETYRVSPEKVWDLGDSAWWLQNVSGLVESAGEFITTGYGVGGALGKVSNSLAKAVRAGRGLQGMLSGTAGLANSATLAYVEGAMSGSEVYQQVYSEQREKGNDEEYARELAAEAAAATVRTNTVVNSLLNISSGAPFIQGLRTTSKIKQLGLQRNFKESTANYVKRLLKASETNEAIKPLVSRTFKRLGLEAMQEGTEELVNLYSEKVGRVKGQLETGDIGLEGFFEEALTEEGALSFVLGAFGGIAQTAGTQNIPFYKQIKKDAEGNPIKKTDKDGNVIEGQFETEYKSVRQLQNDRKMQEYTGYVSDLLDDLQGINSDLNKLQEVSDDVELSTEEKEAQIREIKDRMFGVTLKKSMYTGTSQNLIQTYREIADVTNTLEEREGEIKELNAKLQEVNQQLANPDLDDAQKAALEEEGKSIKKSIDNAQSMTQAEERGLSTRGDDSYKEEAQQAIDKIVERSAVYDDLKARFSYGDEETFRLPDYLFSLYNAYRDLESHTDALNMAIEESFKAAEDESERTGRIVRGADLAGRRDAIQKTKNTLTRQKALLNNAEGDSLTNILKELGVKSTAEGLELIRHKEDKLKDLESVNTKDIFSYVTSLPEEDTERIRNSKAYKELESKITYVNEEDAYQTITNLNSSVEENARLLEELIAEGEEENQEQIDSYKETIKDSEERKSLIETSLRKDARIKADLQEMLKPVIDVAEDLAEAENVKNIQNAKVNLELNANWYKARYNKSRTKKGIADYLAKRKEEYKDLVKTIEESKARKIEGEAKKSDDKEQTEAAREVSKATADSRTDAVQVITFGKEEKEEGEKKRKEAKELSKKLNQQEENGKADPILEDEIANLHRNTINYLTEKGIKTSWENVAHYYLQTLGYDEFKIAYDELANNYAIQQGELVTETFAELFPIDSKNPPPIMGYQGMNKTEYDRIQIEEETDLAEHNFHTITDGEVELNDKLKIREAATTLAYKTKDFVDDGFQRKTVSNELYEHTDHIMLSKNRLLPGDKITLRFAQEGDDLNPFAEQELVEYKDDDMNRPVVAVHNETGKIFYIHKLDWITQENVVPEEVSSQRDRMIRIRERILELGEVPATITYKGAGKVSRRVDEEGTEIYRLGSEALKDIDVDFALGRGKDLYIDEETKVDKSNLVNRRTKIINTGVYALLPTPSGETFAKFLLTRNLNENDVNSAANLIKAYVTKNEDIRKKIFDAINVDIFTPNGITKALGHFVYAARFDPDLVNRFAGIDYKYINVVDGNVYWMNSGFHVKVANQSNIDKSIEDIKAHLAGMFRQIDRSQIGGGEFKRLVIQDNGNVDTVTYESYGEYIKESVYTELQPNILEDGEVTFFDQPNIHFELDEVLAEREKGVETEEATQDDVDANADFLERIMEDEGEEDDLTGLTFYEDEDDGDNTEDSPFLFTSTASLQYVNTDEVKKLEQKLGLREARGKIISQVVNLNDNSKKRLLNRIISINESLAESHPEFTARALKLSDGKGGFYYGVKIFKRFDDSLEDNPSLIISDNGYEFDRMATIQEAMERLSDQLVVKGLNPVQQKKLATHFAANINARIKEDKKNSKKPISTLIEELRKQLMPLKEKSNLIGNLVQEDNWKIFSGEIIRNLYNSSAIVAGKSYKRDVEEQEDDSIEEAIELGLIEDRIDWSDDRAFKINPKNTLTVRFKNFLSYIESGTKEKIGSFGVKNYVDSTVAYNDMLAILQNTPNDFDAKIKELSKHVYRLKYLQNVIADLKNAPEDIKNSFVAGTNKHTPNYKRIQHSKDSENNIIGVNIDASFGVGYKQVEQEWKESFTNMPEVQTYSDFLKSTGEAVQGGLLELDLMLSDSRREAIVSAFNTLVEEEGYNDNEKISEFFSTYLGINIPPYIWGRLRDDIRAKQEPLFEGIETLGDLFTSNRGIIRSTVESLIVPKRNKGNHSFYSIENNTIVDNNSKFRRIAMYVAKNADYVVPSSVRNGEGKVFYNYASNKFLTDRVKELKYDINKSKSLLENPFNSTSFYLRSFAKDDVQRFRDRFNFFTVDTLNKKGRPISGVRLHKQSETQREFYKIALFQNRGLQEGGARARRMSNFLMPSMGKTTMMGIEFYAEDLKIDSLNNYEITAETVTNIVDVVEGEAKRINYYNDLKAEGRLSEVNNQNWQDGGGKFIMFPFLNDVQEIWTEERVNLNNREAIENAVIEYVKKLVDNKLQKWEKYKVIDKENNKTLFDKAYVEKILKRVASEDDKENFDVIARLAAIDLVVNYAVFNGNMFQTIIGDPALFWKKNLDETRKNIEKRLTGLLAPGDGQANNNREYIQVFAKDVNRVSPIIEDLTKLLDDKQFVASDLTKLSSTELKKKYPRSHPYMEIQTTDAQEYITWRTHLNNLYHEGKLSKVDKDKVTGIIESGKELSVNQLQGLFNPVKPVYTGMHQIKDFNIEEFVYIKSSEIPLYPQLVKDRGLEKVYNAMEALEKKHGKDVHLVFKSGAKVGQVSEENLVNLEADTIEIKEQNYKLLNKQNYKKQQEVPYKKDDSTNVDGSQKIKLLFNNIKNVKTFKYDGIKSWSGAELEQEYIKEYSKLYELKRQELLKSIDYDEKTGKANLVKLSEMLIKEGKRRGYSTNELKYLKLNKEKTGFVTDLWMSPIGAKVESFLTSVIDNRVRNVKVPGRSFVLGSEFGFMPTKTLEETKNPNIIWKKGYKPSDQLAPDEIVIPIHIAEAIAGGNALNRILKDGMIDTSIMPEELLKIVGYRIPTEDLHSIKSLKIVGLLPKASGDLVIASSHLIAQMGSDFDIDKLYSSMYSIYFDEESGMYKKLKEEDVQARLKKHGEDLYRKINNIRTITGDNETLLSSALSSAGFEQEIDDIELQDLLDKNKFLQYLEAKLKQHAVYNKIIDINHAVLENKDPEVQKHINSPTSYGELPDIRDEIAAARSKEDFMLSDDYQSDLYRDTNSASDAVGVFALNMTFNSQLQNKNVELVTDEKGNGAFIFNGHKVTNLSGEYTLDKKRYKSEIQTAFASSAVDDGKEKILSSLNIGDETYDAIRAMVQLGFNEREIMYFINQPVILELNDRIRQNKRKLEDDGDAFVSDATIKSLYQAELTAIALNKIQETKSSSATFSPNADYDIKLEDLENVIKGEDTSILKEAFDAHVVAKFIQISTIGQELSRVQNAINADSKGAGKDIYDVTYGVDQLLDLYTNMSFTNMDKVIGEYMPQAIQTDDTFYPVKGMYIKPETIHGLASIHTRVLAYDLFANETRGTALFPYGINALVGDGGILGYIKEFTTLDDSTRNRKWVLKEVRNYLLSTVGNPAFKGLSLEEERQRLLIHDVRIEAEIEQVGIVKKVTQKINIINPSLAYRVKMLKKQTVKYPTKDGKFLEVPRFRNNTFLNLIRANINSKTGEPSTVEFNKATSLDTDVETITQDFIQLFTRQEGVSEKDHKEAMEVARDLVAYAYLTGAGKQKNDFLKFVPMEFLVASGILDFINNIEVNQETLGIPTNGRIHNLPKFVIQFIQHYPYLLRDDAKVPSSDSTLFNELANEEGNIVLPEASKVGNPFKYLVGEYAIKGSSATRQTYPPIIAVEDADKTKGFKLYVNVNAENNEYSEISTLGDIGLDEYDWNMTYPNSMFKRNNPIGNSKFSKSNQPVNKEKGVNTRLQDTKPEVDDIKVSRSDQNLATVMGVKVPGRGAIEVSGENISNGMQKVSNDSVSEFLGNMAKTNGVKIKFSNAYSSAKYNPVTHTIMMPSSADAARGAEVLKHEIVHSEVSSKIKEVTDYLTNPTMNSKPNGDLLQAVKRLMKLQESVIAKIDSGELKELGYTKEEREELQELYYRGKKETLSDEEIARRNNLTRKYYAFMNFEGDNAKGKDPVYTNLSEFVAEVMSNSSVQTLLNGFEDTGRRKTVLQKFIDYITDILRNFKIIRPDGTRLELSKGSALEGAIQDVVIVTKSKSRYNNRENLQKGGQQLDNPAFLEAAKNQERLKKIRKYKENLLKKLEKQVSNELTKPSNYVNDTTLAKLNKMILDTTDQLVDLKEGISYLKIREIAEDDMQLLNAIVNQDPDKITDEELELGNIISDLWSNVKHLIFSKDEIALDKERKSSPNVEMFEGIIEAATSYSIQISDLSAKRLIDYIQRNLGKTLTQEELEAFKDVNALKSYFLDITHFDNRGISLIDNFARTASQKTNEEFLKINKKIEQMTAKIPQQYKDFNFMLQEDEKGKPNGNLVNRYSKNYFDIKYKLLRDARTIGGKDSWKTFFNFVRDNEINIDPSKMYTLKDGEYVITTNPLYEEELKKQLGSTYKQDVEKGLELLNEYHRQKLAHTEYINSTDMDEASKASNLERWELENSPFAYLESMKSKTVKKVGNKVVKPGGYKYLISVPKKVKEDGSLTGWHDPKFEAIQNDAALKEFYDFTTELLNSFYRFIPESKKNGISSTTLPFIQKNFMDLFKGKEGKKMLHYTADHIVDLVTRGNTSEVVYDIVDTVTGKKEKNLSVRYLDFEQRISELTEKKIIEYAVDNDMSVKQVNKDTRKRLREQAKKELNQERTFDIEAILKTFAASALTYKHKSRVETPIKIAYNVINNALETTSAANGRPLVDRDNDPILKRNGLANLKASLDYYMETFYGKKNKDEGVSGRKVYTRKESALKKKLETKKSEVEKILAEGGLRAIEAKKRIAEIDAQIADLGKNIVGSSVGRMLLNYNQIKSMGWNMFSATANLGFGWVSNFIHAAGKEDFSSKHLLKAKMLLMNNVATSVSDYTIQKALRTPISEKISNVVEKFDMVKEINEANYGRYSDNKGSAKGLSKFMPLELQRRSEFIIQAEMGIATLLATEIKEGVSLWDALDNNGELKAEYKDMKDWDWDTNPGSDVEGNAIRKVKFRIDQLSKSLHGNYDYNSPIYAKSFFLGKAALQFRSWMAEGFANRFQGKRYDDLLDREVKGRWRSFVSLTNEKGEEERNILMPLAITGQNILNILTRGLVFSEAGSTLNEVDRANLRKNAAELIIYGAMWSTLLALKAAASDDDDEEAFLNFLINAWNRVETDITFYMSPTAFEDITRNSVPLSSLITDTFDFVDAANKAIQGEDEIKTGIYKGNSRLFREGAEMFPFGKAYYRTISSSKQVYE